MSLPSDVDGSREDEASGYDQFTFRQYFKLLPLTNNTALQQYADNTQLFISLVLFSQGKHLLTFPTVTTDEVSVMQHIQYGIKSLSKFTTALPWLLLLSILGRCIILRVFP